MGAPGQTHPLCVSVGGKWWMFRLVVAVVVDAGSSPAEPWLCVSDDVGLVHGSS